MSKNTVFHRVAVFGLGAALLAGASLLAVPWAQAAPADQPRPTGTPRAVLTSQARATQVAGTAAAQLTRVAGTATTFRATADARATALSGTATAVRLTRTPIATVPADQAAQVIRDYAQTVLGLSVQVTKAGGGLGSVVRDQALTPLGQKAQVSAAQLTGTTYWAKLSNGAATLSVGGGVITTTVPVSLSNASLGNYTLVFTNTTAPTSAEAALTLAQATFPGVANRTFAPYTVSKGWAWYALNTVRFVDPVTRRPVSQTEVVLLYVLPGSGGRAVSVTASVARGDYTALLAP